MRGEIQSRVAERQLGVVEKNQIGMITVNQVFDAVEKLGHIRRVRLRADGVVLRIQILRVEALPPQTFAVGLGQFAVVGNAGQRPGFVAALRVFIPVPRAGAVNAHAKLHAGCGHEFLPGADDVFFRADVDGIPRLKF